MRLTSFCVCLLFASLTGICAPAQTVLSYTSTVVFGDSLSDTGDFLATAQKAGLSYPGPSYNYTLGRFTDGADTTPAARAYLGVWHEQLTGMLPGAPLSASFLAGAGGNHAFGDATSAAGTTTIAAGPYTLSVRNLGQQVTDFLATQKPASTQLFVLFVGANDFLQNNSASPATVVGNITASVQQLVSAGAVNFVIPNLPPLGDSSTLLGQDAIAYRTQLAQALAQLQAKYSASGTPFHLVQVDLFSAEATLLSAPASYGFSNTTTAANTLPASANPDTYLSWDGLHPTTAGHNVIATAVCSAMTGTTITLSATGVSTAASPGSLTAAVDAATPYPATTLVKVPSGYVSFFADTTANGVTSHTLLGTAKLSGSLGSVPVATLPSTAVSQGIYTGSAVYSGDSSYPQGCRSRSVSFTVVNTSPGFVVAATPAAVSATAGSSATTTVAATAVGGFTGSAALSCGTLPQYVTCSFSNAAIGVGGAGSTLTLNTQVITSARGDGPGWPFHPQGTVVLALLPAAWLLRRRRRGSTALFLVLACAGSLMFTGCAGSGGSSATSPQQVTHTAAQGTYTIAINADAGGGVTAQSSVVLTVK